jgi:hypothetical protein
MLGSVGLGSIYEAGLGSVTLDRVKLSYSGLIYPNFFFQWLDSPLGA